MVQTTWSVDLVRLKACGDDAIVIIGLMLACNDIYASDRALIEFSKERSPIHKNVQRGERMYFSRLLMGHLKEAMKFVKTIKDNPKLSNTVENCSPRAKSSFSKLTNCLKGGSDYKKFTESVEKIRHKTAFHYDRSEIKNALCNRASRPETRKSKITGGDDISLYRCDLADDIVNSIVVRQVWKIPRTDNERNEIEERMGFILGLCRSLTGFCGEFFLEYMREHRTFI